MTPAERLEWQSELDSALSDLDSRLTDPRRRANEVAAEPVAPPPPGQLSISSELIDEIASRVAAQMRAAPPGAADAPPRSASVAAPSPEPAKPVSAAIPDGISLVIRVRWPLFHWKFWRRRSRRRQAMITFSDYRIT